MNDYLSFMGFVEVTKDRPIDFIEKFPVTFGNIYMVDSRWERQNAGVKTEILIGSDGYYQVHIIGKSFFGGCMSSFCIQEHKDHYKEILERYIYSNEEKVVSLFAKAKEVKLKNRITFQPVKNWKEM